MLKASVSLVLSFALINSPVAFSAKAAAAPECLLALTSNTNGTDSALSIPSILAKARAKLKAAYIPHVQKALELARDGKEATVYLSATGDKVVGRVVRIDLEHEALVLNDPLHSGREILAPLNIIHSIEASEDVPLATMHDGAGAASHEQILRVAREYLDEADMAIVMKSGHVVTGIVTKATDSSLSVKALTGPNAGQTSEIPIDDIHDLELNEPW